MPNLITHAIFTSEVVEKINNKRLVEHMKKYQHLLLIGTNGPDFLFFYTKFAALKKKDVDINKLGSKIHKQHINDQYLNFIKYYHKQQNKKLKEQLAVYISGHFLHWVLDSTLHPYIVYVTGFKEKQSLTFHHRLESNLDALLLKEKYNKTIKDIKTYKICTSYKQERKIIADTYKYMIMKTFGYNIEAKVFEKALRDWKNAQRLMYSPRGIKKKIAKKIEKTEGLLSDMLVPKDYVDDIDIMNRNHKEWRNPVTGEKSNESIDELICEAKQTAVRGLDLLWKSFDDEKYIVDFLNIIDNKTYSNGVKGSQKREYKQCIYK